MEAKKRKTQSPLQDEVSGAGFGGVDRGWFDTPDILMHIAAGTVFFENCGS
jgi:hypothetical protein